MLRFGSNLVHRLIYTKGFKNGPGFGVGPPDPASLEVRKVPDPPVPPGVKYKLVPSLLTFATGW
jgi:hypothetical protein